MAIRKRSGGSAVAGRVPAQCSWPAVRRSRPRSSSAQAARRRLEQRRTTATAADRTSAPAGNCTAPRPSPRWSSGARRRRRHLARAVAATGSTRGGNGGSTGGGGSTGRRQPATALGGPRRQLRRLQEHHRDHQLHDQPGQRRRHQRPGGRAVRRSPAGEEGVRRLLQLDRTCICGRKLRLELLDSQTSRAVTSRRRPPPAATPSPWSARWAPSTAAARPRCALRHPGSARCGHRSVRLDLARRLRAPSR